MSNVTLSVLKEFTDAPGARNYTDGDCSGEEFYEKLLAPKFVEALETNRLLEIDMDGTYGYATSFISQAFGSLSKEHGPALCLNTIKIKSEEDAELEKYIYETIKDPDKQWPK